MTDRASSMRYRWEDGGGLDDTGGGGAERDIAADDRQKPLDAGTQSILLRQQVAQAMDTTGWGTILVSIDVTLSILSVVLYIAMTYHPLNALYQADLGLAVIFAANFFFWFWISEDRMRYLFSGWAIIDYITIIPSFIMYGINAVANVYVPGLNFLRVLRILRVLRVFRMKHIMRRHLEGAVMEAAGKLIFSLLSIVFIAAGLFYELERWGPYDEKKTEDLKFHQAIYWATVSVTTLGYGDIVPTYWATQVMLICLLMFTFTLLPYLTGNLMDALTSTSVYQRKSFTPSRRSDVTHVVVMGFLDGATVQGLLNELYHEDKGFNRNYAVFLSERPPSQDVQHVLATHPATRKLVYLQGSPFRQEDLRRTGAEYASAIFLIAPKYPEDATLADRYLTMSALSLGQYLQEAHTRMVERLSHAPNRIMHWMKHSTVLPPSRLPNIYMQVCLPEGRLRLFQVLQSLQKRHRKSGSGSSHHPACEPRADAAAAAKDTDPVVDAAAAATRSSSAHPDSSTSLPAAAADATARSDGVHPTGSNGDAAVDLSAFARSTTAGTKAAPAVSQPRGLASWFAWCCSNSNNDSRAHQLHQHQRELPVGCSFWSQYSGSIHVLCLAEIKFAMMSHSVVGVPGTMTLLCNLSSTVDFGLDRLEEMESLPQWLRDYMVGASQELYQLPCFPATLVGRTVREAAGFIFDSCHAVLLAVEGTKGTNKHRLSVGDLNRTITSDMRGFIIADDISSVLVIEAAKEGDFELWHTLRQQHLLSQLASPRQGDRRSSQGGAGLAGQFSGAGKRLGGVVSGGMKTHKQQDWKLALMRSSSLQLPQNADPSRARAVAMKFSNRPQATSEGGMDAAAFTPIEQNQLADLDAATIQQEQQQAAAQHSAAAADGSNCTSSGGDVGGAGANGGATSQPMGRAASSLRQSSAVSALVSAANAAGLARTTASGHASALGALIHLLRSPSKPLRQQGYAFLQAHYHLRPKGSIQSAADILVEEVDVSAHTLVLGLPASADGLLTLLAALRSKRLLHWRPVVIVDSKPPGGGGTWEAVAQFRDVYFIEVRDGLNDALLRASAERAAQAILMTPLTMQQQDGEDHRLASKVMTDAVVLNTYQLLRSLNPDIELLAELMLPSNMAYLSATPPVPGVDHKYLHLMSPAYVSGSVFNARLLDDMTIASYANSGSDRIVLQLLHRWHMGWAGVQAFTPGAKEQQQEGQQHQHSQKQDGREQAQQRFNMAAAVVVDKLEREVGPGAAKAASTLAARAADHRGVPTLMQIPVECAPGTTYGRYFHTLLHTRGLLLLGVHRLVEQDGTCFRATITNPSYHSEMQPDDNAFVVARLDLPGDCSDPDAVAAAWPPDTLGFSNLDPMPAQMQDLLVDEDAVTTRQHSEVTTAGGIGLQGRLSSIGAVAVGSFASSTGPTSYPISDSVPPHSQTLHGLQEAAEALPHPFLHTMRSPSDTAAAGHHSSSSLSPDLRAAAPHASVARSPSAVAAAAAGAGPYPMVGTSTDWARTDMGPPPGSSDAAGQQQSPTGQHHRSSSILLRMPGVQGAVFHPNSRATGTDAGSPSRQLDEGA